MKSKRYEPKDHYADNPADEIEDYNGPEIDYTIHQGSAGGDASDIAKAVENVSSYGKQKPGSRSEAASRMMEDEED